MKNEPWAMLREVWAMKEAAQEETKGLSTKAYFRHIRKRIPDLGLPIAPAPRSSVLPDRHSDSSRHQPKRRHGRRTP